MQMTTMLRLENISKHYYDKFGNAREVLRKLSMDVTADKINTIIAPSKSGLSTLLRICSGLEPQTEGKLTNYFEENIVFIPSAQSIFPWLNVYDNMKINSPRITPLVIRQHLSEVGLDGYEDYLPSQNSEGFNFRLALARSFMNNPKLLVFDNAMSHLKPEERFEVYEIMKTLKNKHKLTLLLGTNNLTEALCLSDKILLMSREPGEIIQEFEVNFNSNSCVELLGNKEMHDLRNYILEIYRQFRGHYKYTFTI